MKQRALIALSLTLLLVFASLPAFSQDDDAPTEPMEVTPEAEMTPEMSPEAEVTDEPDDPVDTSGDSAPVILSITPDVAEVAGRGYAVVTVNYDDADGDARRFDWRVLDSDMSFTRLPSGIFEQSFVGTEIATRFYCWGPTFEATFELTVVDAMGHVSDPATFEMICTDGAEMVDTPDEDDTGGMDDMGSAPVIETITPDAISIDGTGFATVTVNYDDADGDAVRFEWRVLDNDMEYSVLPAGEFAQELAGAEIATRFYCFEPAFEATFELTVVDAMGNASDPATFEMTCAEEE